MPRRKNWLSTEVKILIDHYADKTIYELMEMLPGRSQESINNKIKRMKSAGKIKGGKEDVVIKRSYEQRGKETL